MKKRMMLGLMIVLLIVSACAKTESKDKLDPTMLFFSSFYVGPLKEIPDQERLTLNDTLRIRLSKVLKTLEWVKTDNVSTFESAYALKDGKNRTIYFSLLSDKTLIVIVDEQAVMTTYTAPLSVFDATKKVLESIIADVRPSASQQASVFIAANILKTQSVNTEEDFALTPAQSADLSALLDIPHWKSATFKDTSSYDRSLVLYTGDGLMVSIYKVQDSVYAIFSDLEMTPTSQDAYLLDVTVQAIKDFLTPLVTVVPPSDQLINAKLTHMYIGQGYGEITFLKPEYFQTLNASQSQTLSDRIDRSTWTQLARFEPMSEWGAMFVLTDELGNTYYFMGEDEHTTVNVVNGSVSLSFTTHSSGINYLRQDLVNWYVPKGVLPVIRDFVFNEAYKANELEPKTLISTLTSAQSQKIMALLDLDYWKQAYDVMVGEWSYVRFLTTANGDKVYISDGMVHVLRKENETLNTYSKYDVYILPEGAFNAFIDYLNTLGS